MADRGVDAMTALIAENEALRARNAVLETERERIEQVVRTICHLEDSELDDDGRPSPLYCCLDEDGDPIIESDELPLAVEQIADRLQWFWRAMDRRELVWRPGLRPGLPATEEG